MSGHVSMMNDVLITQLPPHILRATMRQIISQNAKACALFTQHVRSIYRASPPEFLPAEALFPQSGSQDALKMYLSNVRCLFSCHMVEECLPYLIHLLRSVLKAKPAWTPGSELESTLETNSADIVQAIQAIKEARTLWDGLESSLLELLDALHECNDYCLSAGLSQPYTRTQLQVADCISLLFSKAYLNGSAHPTIQLLKVPQITITREIESIQLSKQLSIPRMFNGLWQMSSPAWGSASAQKMDEALLELASQGLVAADMADHYGDAEIVYGAFRNRLPKEWAEKIICATKWCVFAPLQKQVDKELVLAAVEERCRRVGGRVELLQFHWQQYANRDFLPIVQHLVELTQTRPDLVSAIGLCNFDAVNLEAVCEYMIAETGSVGVVSNQVQYSLIDSRPLFAMAEVCKKYGVKLLTYGSFCGGFLSDRWLNKPQPASYDESKPLTPSQRKYLDMIYTWGTWEDFASLLQALRAIADQYNVDVSNVATRWVLQRPEVAAVIVGTRLGISSNSDANLKAFSFELSPSDIAKIEAAALGKDRSKARKLFETVGDCGQEYR